MKKIVLEAEKREKLGKKVGKLRRDNILPANLYGKDIKSISVKVDSVKFNETFKKAGNTQIVYLNVNKEEYPVLIQNLQKHPLSRKVLHVNFRKMDLKEKIEADVPIETTGEVAVVKSGEGDLIIITDKITVSSLPANIPEKITIDLSVLKAVGDEIKIKDLPKGKLYEFVDDPEKTVIHIAEAQKEEIVPEVVTEDVEAEEAATDQAKPDAEEQKTEANQEDK
jgi:large subunit ribosomal protein L25